MAISKMQHGYCSSLGNLVIIGHGNNPEAANQLNESINIYY